MKKQTIARDISWLSFNERVLQEARDKTVPLKERIRFLGIFSNNLDEFFRVRVATLNRMAEMGSKIKNMHLEHDPKSILDEIQQISIQQQIQFNQVWEQLKQELKAQHIHLPNEKQLNRAQQKFVVDFFEEEVRPNIIPLMIEDLTEFPYLRDKSLYLGVLLSKKDGTQKRKYALIEVPSKIVGRFIQLPSPEGQQSIILLEDVIRYNLKSIFSYFGYDRYKAWVFKVTKDAEIDIDNDISTSIVQKIEKGLKNRRKGKPVRFVYDKEMDEGLLDFLIRKLNISRNESIIPGGRIHNFRHFMDFPDVFVKQRNERKKPFLHPLLKNTNRVTDVILQKDVLLNFPYHSFNPIIDLLREAAFDPKVVSIKITAYRLAPNSKIINALINAVRNGKEVTVMLELRARFDEEANLEWKERLEEEGVKVLQIIPNQKVHAKICVIKKRQAKGFIYYGFVSTGNFNGKTAKIYGDHCLLTSHKTIMDDINRIFNYLEQPKTGLKYLKACKSIVPCPITLRNVLVKNINREIIFAKQGKPASIILKMNSLSDEKLILKLMEAARKGVRIHLIIRGIFCMYSENEQFVHPVQAISIIDEYLEHARVFLFNNNGNEKIYISSADWMVRNLDHRVEATCPIYDADIKKVLKNILQIQLSDNVKARILDNSLSNTYVPTDKTKKIRSQLEIYNYLQRKKTIKLPGVNLFDAIL